MGMCTPSLSAVCPAVQFLAFFFLGRNGDNRRRFGSRSIVPNVVRQSGFESFRLKLEYEFGRFTILCFLEKSECLTRRRVWVECDILDIVSIWSSFGTLSQSGVCCHLIVPRRLVY